MDVNIIGTNNDPFRAVSANKIRIPYSPRLYPPPKAMKINIDSSEEKESSHKGLIATATSAIALLGVSAIGYRKGNEILKEVLKDGQAQMNFFQKIGVGLKNLFKDLSDSETLSQLKTYVKEKFPVKKTTEV